AAVAAAAAVLRRRRRRGPPAAPARPAHEIALEEIARLLAADLPGRGLVREFYASLSDIVRRYIERRFGLNAPDRTTEEFLLEAGAAGGLPERERGLVGDFLARCDLVKFARYGPRAGEIAGAAAAARRFIEETKAADAAGGG
ncbi:MAG: hypothetical protein PHN82_06325, partial [bacterium]|nr:hypothetical protein [bacterium]